MIPNRKMHNEVEMQFLLNLKCKYLGAFPKRELELEASLLPPSRGQNYSAPCLPTSSSTVLADPESKYEKPTGLKERCQRPLA